MAAEGPLSVQTGSFSENDSCYKVERDLTETIPHPNSKSNLSEIKDNEESEWQDILGSGQLKKKILKFSVNYVRPERGDLCTLNFVGCLDNGRIVENQKDLKIHLGDLQVINGIDLAVALMQEGEEADLIVEPRFAYGNLGLKPDIPPNSRITYRIILSAVEREVPISELDIVRRLTLGKTKKERGNWWYSRDEFGFAIQCYRRALEFFDTDIPSSHNFSELWVEGEVVLRDVIDEKLKTYNNLAQAQIKISAYDGALMSLGHVLSCQPQNIKAIYRKAKILKQQGNIEESISAIRKGLSVEPESQLLNQELSSLLATLKRNNEKEMNLFKKMMGNKVSEEIPQDDKPESPSSPSNNSVSWVWVTVVSFAVAVIGAFAIKYKY